MELFIKIIDKVILNLFNHRIMRQTIDRFILTDLSLVVFKNIFC